MDTFLKRLLAVCAALFLLWYVGYQVFQVFYSPITIDTVTAYSVYDTVDTEGIAIREETTIADTAADSYLYYSIQNGSRVAKGGTIAKLFPNEAAASAKRQLETLDEEIEELKSVEAQGNANRANLDAINKQLSAAMQSLSECIHGTSLDQLSELHGQLLSLMNKQQMTIGKVTSFSDRLAVLAEKRNQLAAQATEPTGTVTAPVAGYFVDEVDGYESMLSIENVVSLSVEQLSEAMSAQPAAPEGFIGKMAGDYQWYLACVVPSEKVTELGAGKQINVLLPFVSGDPIPVKVAAVNKDKSGRAAVILECDSMSESLSIIRKEPLQILVREYNGLRVPDEALQFNDQNESGVYVRVGTIIEFRKVNVLYHSENDNYSICEITDEAGYLQLYDDMVIGGKNLYDGKILN